METVTKSVPDGAVLENGLDDSFAYPIGTGIIDVIGDCLEPAIRDGQKAFIFPHDGSEITPGTPVVLELSDGRRIIKLWRGLDGGYIALRYLNGRNGKPGTLFIPADKLSKIWIVGGLWFNGVPFKAERPMAGIPVFSLEQLEAKVRRSSPIDAHTLHATQPTPGASSSATTSARPPKRSARKNASAEDADKHRLPAKPVRKIAKKA